jgi:flagellar motor component MotA
MDDWMQDIIFMVVHEVFEEQINVLTDEQIQSHEKNRDRYSRLCKNLIPV